MTCQNCKSTRIAHVSGRCVDQCMIRIGDKRSEDYVPSDMAIGGGDYMTFSYCLDCGQIQDKFPLTVTELEAN